MKLLDKIKTALFEEEEEEIVKPVAKPVEEEKIAHKIDVERTIEDTKPDLILPKMDTTEEVKKGPIIFDDEDFLSDTKEIIFKEPPRKEEKVLYGGYDAYQVEKPKEKFKPSPVLSPVYGIISKPETKEENTSVSLDYLFADSAKKEMTFDEIREKAYGNKVQEEPIQENKVLYDAVADEEMPGVEKVTLGDAEEYFEDLGLEYEVDYKDAAKEKEKMTRIKKNKDLSDTIDNMIDDEMVSYEESEDDKIKRIVNKGRKKTDDEEQQPEEKNLYDLIDMMYDNK